MSEHDIKHLQFERLDGPGVVSIEVPAALHRRAREIEALGARFCIARGRGRCCWSLQLRGPCGDRLLACVDSDARGVALSAAIAGLVSYAHAVLFDPPPWQLLPSGGRGALRWKR